MKYCMNCGKQLPDDAKFCIDCGTPVNAESSKRRVEQAGTVYKRDGHLKSKSEIKRSA